MSEPITIEDVARLDIQPGEVLLVTVPRGTSAEDAAQVKEVFGTQLPDVKVIIKTPDIRVEVVAEERQIQEAVDRTAAEPGKTFEAGRS